ncbi:MAG: hypothetical protein KatS3mg102_2312 [Planctomycetota bacterium]|nr:MAG: hypothetical protein KatS3mg102_2312 [Planctomycetota bacterium]
MLAHRGGEAAGAGALRPRPAAAAARLRAAVLALGAVAGCATPPAAPLEEVLAAQVVQAPAPSDLRLAVAPLAVLPEAALGPEAAEEDSWSPVPIEPAALREQLTRAVVASGAFRPERVRFLDALAEAERAVPGPLAPAAGAADGAAADPQDGERDATAAQQHGGRRVLQVPPPLPLVAILDAAFARGDDLALVLRVRRHAIRFAGTNGWYWPNVLTYLAFVWPAWFVADERYAAELELEAALYAVGSARELWRKSYAAAPLADLDHIDHGLQPFRIIGLQRLGPSNYALAAQRLMPYAVNQLAAALGRDLAAGLWQQPRERFAARTAKTLALCVGVGRYQDPAIRDPRLASDDASAFAALLVDPQRGGLPARNVTLLVERAPTRAAVLAALDAMRRRAREGDTLLVYFAGLGFESEGQLYLAPHDLVAARPTETALAVDELLAALGGSGAREVIILDASFGEPPGASGRELRTLARASVPALPPPAPERARQWLEGLLGADAPPGAGHGDGGAAPARCTLVLGADPGTAALALSPLPEDKHGLFTARLLDAASWAKADEDRDGWLSLAELLGPAERDTVRLSGQAGMVQVPLVLGHEPGEVRLVRAPR